MVTTLYVVRHGLRANADPPPTGIDGDPRLTAEGVIQAQELARHLAAITKDAPIQAIYSSPFYRCIETARPCAQALQLPVLVERGLSEHYAPGRPTKPVPWTPKQSKDTFFPEIDLQYESQVSVSLDGETRNDLRTRVRQGLDAVLRHAAQHNYERIVIYTHAAIKITIAEVLTGLEPRAGTCSMDTLVNNAPASSDPQWVLQTAADTSFLSGGEQMHWSFDMAVEAGSAADEASRTSTKSAPEASGAPRVLADGSVLPGSGNPAKPTDSTKSASTDVETSTLLVSLDTSSLASEDLPTSYVAEDIHVVNADSSRPIVQIGSKVYEGEWQRTVGTEVYTSFEGEPVGQAEHRIKLLKAVVEPAPVPAPLMERL